jgi:hypothetical protein
LPSAISCLLHFRISSGRYVSHPNPHKPSIVNTQKVYILFGVFCAAMFIHVFFMFPETAGKSLEQVESMFTDPQGRKWLGTSPWRTAVVKRTLDLDPNEKETSHQQDEKPSDEERGILQPASVQTSHEHNDRTSDEERGVVQPASVVA